jgi:YesN/AraC family two-component response regulator
MKCNILVVDDEPMVREGLKLALEMEGYAAITASDGNEALKLVERNKPNLIITDIIMPDRDGIEVICSVRKKNPDIKIIAISGGGRISASDHLRAASQLGANAILAKPFTTDQLLNEIRKIFAA